eukprot:TRINITY_DN6389_c0_g2_i1.p1 TRINITY_DN6389_c0_g2~~TRINITY_DN6389_c0_g2_i1.p1  ORF type:complete len:465 (+),score=50.64 TRINITY_DN6389_c0_g2_i1:162-1397(+)
MEEKWPKRALGYSLTANDSKDRNRMVARTQDIKRLLSEGYDQLAAANALEQANNQVDMAISLLNAEGSKIDPSELASTTAMQNNFVAWTMMYMLSRMRNCTAYCVICDKKLDGTASIKPVVCTDAACQWRQEELGLGLKVVSELMLDSSIVDLFICMLVAACSSNRRDKIFNPFPSDFVSGTTRDYNKVQAVLSKMPAVSAMMLHTANEREFRQYLEKIDSNAYRLLRWCLATCRAYFSKLPPSKHIQQMITPHQYILLSSPPEKRAKFENYRKQYGSFFAFHGSSVENWHAILRTGLRNLSGTSLMTTGAVYGAGIYLSPDCGVSVGYAKSGSGWAKSQFGASALVCMAICEVIQHPSLKGQPNPHYVVGDEDLVITRFFCVYAGSKAPTKVDLKQLQSTLYKIQGYTPS